MKFKTGKLCVTRGVCDRVAADGVFALFVSASLSRHIKGDWGNLSQGDKEANEKALTHGSRLLSNYEEDGLPGIWVITEADRGATTILFPEEY